MVMVEEDRVVVTPDVKNPPDKELSDSKAEPDEGLPTSELEVSSGDANGGTYNHELDNTIETSNYKPDNSESLPNKDQSGNADSPDNNQQFDSEATLNNPSVESETPSDDQPVSSEATPDQNFASEAPPSNLPTDSEVLPNNGVVTSDLQASNGEVVVSETQHSSELALPETQQNNEMVTFETQQSNEVVMSEAQPSNETAIHEAHTSNDVVMTEAMSEHELTASTIDPNNQLSHPETHDSHNHHFEPFHLIPEPESLETNCDPPPCSEPFEDSHIRDIKPIHHDHLSQYDTVPNNHLDHSEALCNHQLTDSDPGQLANSQMLHHYELENHENQLVNTQEHYGIVNANNIPSYEIVNADTPLNFEGPTPETQPNKRRKKKSMVWEHFTIENVDPGCRRAYCKQCKQSFAYSTGSKVAGTSHLKRHISSGKCAALLRGQDLATYTPRARGTGAAGASTTPKRRYRSGGSPYIIFDQDRCRHEIARMIIMHDYPLHMVEHPGFVAFVQNLQPQFNMVTFNTVQGDCVATFLGEKQNLQKYFEGLPGRFCLTLDMWTSSQSVGYVFITGHFVDSDWKLQKRILNVVMEPYPDSESAINHAVSACLSDWNLDGRLFSITCNHALSEVALGNLRSLLSAKNPLILNGQLLVGSCIARTLSSIANDLLRSIQDVVKKIRDSVKYVKTSDLHEEKFVELKQQLQVPSERSLFIDDQTQWNTTYQMLVAASELKEVFSCLDTSDPDYKGAPSMQDWKLVETLCTYLKPLYDAANILTTATHPTAITFFHEVWKLQGDLARAVENEEDPFISQLIKPMQEKIDKYWRECCLVLAIAVVMDPRFKMKLVEFSFPRVFGDDSREYVKIVDDGVHELFNEYVALPLPLTPAYAEGNVKTGGPPGGTLLSDNGLTDFDAYIMETSSQQTKSELDQYLEESLLPRVPEFDVLSWWKLNKLKYPTLSKMARDILSVPVSSVPADSIFDDKNKEMDQYRSSLRPEVVEALVCAKDWMHYGAADASNPLVKIQF
ncbi:unnamed protein product [Trifolium pratense]|uniref:Uncharacterized protein n=1 Tax=Trifolium pratense TaxID=57577 RepID=A0ACB0IS04_TRIPR|nr:unnamed protein product [Trifolium pratense]